MLSGLAELTHYNDRAKARDHEVVNKNGLSLESAVAGLSPLVNSGRNSRTTIEGCFALKTV